MTEKHPIDLWLDALVSNKYIQGRTRLLGVYRPSFMPVSLTSSNSQPRYCCLGVACEVAIANGVDITRSPEGLGYKERSVLFEWSLPNGVAEWLGLNTTSGEFNPEIVGIEDVSSLADLNDVALWSFAKIAEFIRAHRAELTVDE